MIMPAQSSLSPRRSTTTAVKPDELVPSRYAQKVGAIDVLVVSDGVLQISSRDYCAQYRTRRPGGLAGARVPVAGNARVAAERSSGA